MQLNEIALQCKMISLESNTPSQSMEAMTLRLPTVFDGMVSFFKGLFTEREISIKKINPSPVIRLLNSKQYHEVAELMVFVPAGMTTSYPSYVTHLAAMQNLLNQSLVSKINEFSKWIAALLSKPELLASISAESIPFKVLMKDLDDHYTLGKSFLYGGDVTERKFGEVFARNGEWVVTCNSVNVLIEQLAMLDRVSIMRQLDDLNVSLTMLTKRIKEDPAVYKVSGNQLEALSTGVFSLGRLVEAYSIHTYSMATVAKSLSDSGEWLIKH